MKILPLLPQYSSLIGNNVRCYRNLHNGLISVQSKVNGNWKVVAHGEKICLLRPEFKVYETGRQKVLREKRKRVHAFIVGEIAPLSRFFQLDTDYIATYNPYKYDSFVLKTTEEPITTAPCCLIESSGRILVEQLI